MALRNYATLLPISRSVNVTDIEQVLADLSRAMESDISRLLTAATRALNEQALAALDPRGDSGVRLAHVPVFATLDPGGTRIQDLAQRIGISRQAVGVLVHDLERTGHVEIVPDPHDGRATLVRLTPLGVALCAAALEFTKVREAVWRGEHGDAAIDTFKAMLHDFASPAATRE
jgi:DNA-binding MarR family transcriptional regulator